MTFILQNWSRVSTAYNTGIDSEGVNGPSMFTYQNVALDTAATIAGANYFAQVVYDLAVGDYIFANGSDASDALKVATVNQAAGTVTTVSLGLTTNIGTANIQDAAVTYAKIQNIAAVSLVGNPTGGSTVSSGITLVSPLAFTGTTLQVLPAALQYATGTITAAQWNAMYATPLSIIAAPGAGKVIVIGEMSLNYTYGSAAFASGGSTLLQYDSTVHGGGVAASAALPAAGFSDGVASYGVKLAGVLGSNLVSAIANKAIYISNATGAFTTGTGGSFTYYIKYTTVAMA